jgi:hypothetical protein
MLRSARKKRELSCTRFLRMGKGKIRKPDHPI